MSDTSNPPSIRDIAEIAGVSVATVSRVLNKKGKYSATTEKRVLAVVNSCGYISNMSAKSLREARSHTVGLIVPNVTNAFFSQLAYSIETELFQRNYSVFICNSGTDADKERDYFRTLIGKCVDGILCTFATLMFYVLYLVGFHWGANGYLLAIISGDLVSVLFLCITGRLWNYVELKGLNRDLWQQMLRFSLPMIPAQISFWVINASDLFFVREMCGGLDGHSGDAWSGLLSTGYFLPTILTTLGLIFYDAWQLSAVTEEEGRARFFTKIFRTYSSVLFCCAAGIIWLCRPVMHVMKANYYYAWHFVPFLTLASTCSCFNQFLNSAYVVNKKSTHSLWTMLAGAVSNCIMNYFFIKWWGPIGATVASFFGLGIVFVLRALDAHNMIGMSIHPGRVALNFGVLAGEALLLLAEPPLYGLWTGLLTAAIILFNFAGVWAMARMLLPKLLGRRGRALVSIVDNWIKK